MTDVTGYPIKKVEMMTDKIEVPKQEWIISYYSKSDGEKVKRPYNPHSEMQYEFVAKSTGKLCKRYFDTVKGGTRTANAPWTITINKNKRKKVKNGRKNKKV